MGRWTGSGVDEGMSRPTASPYADSKRAAELALEPFGDRLPITILRPTSIFGEGRGLAAALCRLASLPIVPLPGGGRALIPFCYVGNLAHAVGLTIGNPACHGRTFIVGDDRSYMLREIIEELSRALGRRPRLVSVPTAAFQLAAGASGLIGRVRRRPPLFDRSRLTTLTTSVEYSTAAFQAATGYRPPYSLTDATDRIAAWHLSKRGRGARP
jgi:nucleoside-diphosphate-sugar epimerase